MSKFLSLRGKATGEPTIASYVADLTAQLQRELPEVDANEIIAETEAHLRDRVNELVAEGASVSEAGTAAIKGFGPVAVFARCVGHGTVETQASAWVQRVRLVPTIAAFACALAMTGAYPYFQAYIYGPENLAKSLLLNETNIALTFGAALLSSAFVALSSCLARRPQTRTIILSGIVLLFMILLPSAYVGPGHMVSMGTPTDTLLQDLGYCRNEIRVIDQQIDLGNRNAENGLKNKDGLFIAPLKPGPERVGAFIEVHQLRYRYVSSASEAAAAWQANGPLWLSFEKKNIGFDEEQLDGYRRFIDLRSLRPSGYWTWVIPFTTALIVLDWVAAWAGRRIFLSRRRRRMRQTA